MSQLSSPKVLISYAHEDAQHVSLVKKLADQLLQDGVKCALDKYDPAPHQGWPSWIALNIFDEERFILVVSSTTYLRRWLLAERDGVGLGAKYEGKLIREVLYSQEGLNRRIIPVVMDPYTKSHIPPELSDTTRYDVRPDPLDPGYDALLRRLTHQPVATAPPLGEPAALLQQQTADVASVFYILQQVPAPFPMEVLCQTTGMTRDSLSAAIETHWDPPVLHRHADDLLTTTYYRPVHPIPSSPGHLLGQTLAALLSHIRQRGAYATTRAELRNALVLASAKDVPSDVVARVFGTTQSAIKRFGDKRLVWRAAMLSLAAVRRTPRNPEDAQAEALALICGQSWVLQRVKKLEQAEAVARESLELGQKLPWPRNTAFCLKCRGRLSRLRAEATGDTVKRHALLEQSERSLLEAISAFQALPDNDRHAEIGDCQSLLGRTMLVADRWEEARAAALSAESLLSVDAGKDYQDLQILHGDLTVRHDPRSADDFYTAVIDQCARDDAQYSEIRARAYFSRARSQLAQRRPSHAKRDFEAAADIWAHLQDPAASDAQWSALTCSNQLSIDPVLLESKSDSAAVRIRALRIHDKRRTTLRGRAARRTAPVTDQYLDRLIDEATTQVAIDEVDWVSRITETALL